MDQDNITPPEGGPQVSGIDPSQQPIAPEGQAPDGQQQQQFQPPAPAPVSAESIAAAVTQGMQAAQPQPQMTQEQINEQMNVWNPNEEFAQSMVSALTPNEEGQINPAGLASVLQNMHLKQMQQAQTFARASVAQMQQQFSGDLQPLQQQYQQQQQKQSQDAFIKSYPTLKPFSSLMQAAASQLQSTGAVFSTKEQLYPALASTMEQMVKAINPAFTLNNAAPAGQQSGITPASLMAGGQAAGAPQGATSGKSSSIWT